MQQLASQSNNKVVLSAATMHNHPLLKKDHLVRLSVQQLYMEMVPALGRILALLQCSQGSPFCSCAVLKPAQTGAKDGGRPSLLLQRT